jgi:hypothetical protein
VEISYRLAIYWPVRFSGERDAEINKARFMCNRIFEKFLPGGVKLQKPWIITLNHPDSIANFSYAKGAQEHNEINRSVPQRRYDH